AAWRSGALGAQAGRPGCRIAHRSMKGGISMQIFGRPLSPAFWERLQTHPYEYELFQVLRWIDARGGSPKRLGRASTPRQERVRMHQMPHMVFAPSTLAA